MMDIESWLKRWDKLIFIILFLVCLCGMGLRFNAVGYFVGNGGNWYYSYLPSIVIDHDIDFSNQYQELPWLQQDINNPLFYQRHPAYYNTTTGKMQNENSIGPAIVWSPAFIVGHWTAMLVNRFDGPYPTNGFSNIEQIFTMTWSIMLSIIGLYLCYRFAYKFFPRFECMIATLLITFGFAVIHYISIEPSMAHGATIFTVALFITYFYEKRWDHSIKKWFVLGLLGGLMMLSRYQEGFFFLIPFVYWLDMFWMPAENKWKFNYKHHLSLKTALILRGVVMVIGTLIIFSPQLYVWKILYGSPTTLPENVLKIIDFVHPIILQFLFSFQHSLFITTPIIIFAVLGLFFAWKKDRWFVGTLLLALALNIYINASLTELGGNAFGARRMIDCTLIFIFGLAALLTKIRKTKWFYPTMILLLLLVGYNLIYLLEYNLNIINRFLPVTPSMVIEGTKKIIPLFFKFI